VNNTSTSHFSWKATGVSGQTVRIEPATKLYHWCLDGLDVDPVGMPIESETMSTYTGMDI
jgi:hypothetical protein